MTTRVRIKKAYLPKGWSDREYNAKIIDNDAYKIGGTSFHKDFLILVSSPNDQPTTHFIRKMSSVLKDKEAIHCPTEREADEICKLMDKEGWRWCTGESYLEYKSWYREKENSCYIPVNGQYGGKKYCIENYFKITPASAFLPTSFYDELPKEHSIQELHPLIEETTPVLDNKYTAIGTYIENESPSARELFTWLLANEYL